jgi:hypothetical protein
MSLPTTPPKPRRRKFRPGIKAYLLGKVGDLLLVEYVRPSTSYREAETFVIVGIIMRDGFLEVQRLGGRWKKCSMLKQKIENQNWFEFKHASPLTAITFNNLLAAAQVMEE